MAAICSGVYSSANRAFSSAVYGLKSFRFKPRWISQSDFVLGGLGGSSDSLAMDRWNWRRGTRGPAEAAREKLQKRHLAGRAKLMVTEKKKLSGQQRPIESRESVVEER